MKIFNRNTDYQVGDILEMSPTSRSHEKEPYYVEVVFYDKFATNQGHIMTTRIPDMWHLKMIVGNNWAYHSKRMKKVGTIETHSHLLKNQNLLCKRKYRIEIRNEIFNHP